MQEKTVFAIYAMLLIVIFAPFGSFFSDKPVLTILWIFADLVAIVVLTATVFLLGSFDDSTASDGE